MLPARFLSARGPQSGLRKKGTARCKQVSLTLGSSVSRTVGVWMFLWRRCLYLIVPSPPFRQVEVLCGAELGDPKLRASLTFQQLYLQRDYKVKRARGSQGV